MGALAYDGHSVLPGLVPILSGALCLVGLAAVTRPSPETASGVLAQLIALGCLAPICGLAVVAQYHYSSAFLVAGDPAEGWRETLVQVGNLFRIHFFHQDLAFLFAVAAAAALATYGFAPGRRHLRALLVVPSPSLLILLGVSFLPSKSQAFTPPLLPNLGLFVLGVFALSISWTIVFGVAEQFGPSPRRPSGALEAPTEEQGQEE